MGNATVFYVGMNVSGSFLITRKMINEFGKATGDLNPIHFDTLAARAAGFSVDDGEVIAHGDLVIACANRIFTARYEHIVLSERQVRFIRPVRSGDTVEVEGAIDEISPPRQGPGAFLCIRSRFKSRGKLRLECVTRAFTREQVDFSHPNSPSRRLLII